MPLSFLPRFSSLHPESESWWTRTRENLAQLIAPSGLRASSANGAPLHRLKVRRTRRASYAQTVSAATHTCIVVALVLLAIHRPPGFDHQGSQPSDGRGTVRIPLKILNVLGPHRTKGAGSGGDNNRIPAKPGNLPRFSSVQLVRPTVPHEPQPDLPVAPTLLDPSAAPVPISVDNIGLPWMRGDTNSGGPGKGHGIGSRDGDAMGDAGDGQAGFGEGGPYANAVSLPTCAYCPLPAYSDEARQVKMQGTVTLRVLVGVDGKASDIRILRGVGYGLDERAIQTVRGWKFNPARDARNHATATWITVEAIFHLF